MASSINQPFLVITPKRKSSSIKSLFVFLSLASVLCSTAIVLLLLVSNGSSYSFFTLKNPNNICEHAVDQSSCLVMVSEVTHTISSKANKIEILQKILHRTTSQIQETTKLIKNVHLRINDKRDKKKALENCIELMEMSLEGHIDSMVALGNLTSSSHFDVHTWLSSVLTDHDTCMDMLHGQSLAIMKPILKNLMSRASTALALIVSISPTDGGAKEFLIPPLSPIKSYGDYLPNLRGQFPSWVSPADRKLLEASGNNIKPNVVVSKGGNGDYETINEALDKAPTNSNDRYVIQIKKGIYEENVVLASNKRNIMFLGDGMEDTIITGSLNFAAGNGTFDTPTVASNAQGFIAQDLCIQNTAGPEGQQAVALRVTGDFSVINRCKLDAYQDTLYVHTGRQFYRDCYITGSVDFIFGNAAVVLQKCNIVARKPGERQNNMITAQGKTDPNQNTGISIQNCQITPSEDLADVTEQFKTFLGRPWKKYSTTVVMQSYIDGFIDPAGWAPWNGDLYLDTLYYGEYKNKGPGANTRERVTWKGYHIITDPCVAMNFTVANFLGGGEWIEAAGVRFKEGL